VLVDQARAPAADIPAGTVVFRNRTITIVCHGHSVPAGYFKTPVVDTFNAYPHLLHLALKKRFPHAVINVIVTAIGGENSEQGSARFEKDVLCHKPDLITIDYALNDRRIGLEKARQAWTSMIEQAKAKNVKVLLLTRARNWILRTIR
jgi:lysophospholipase L1-like esterase